MRVKEELLYCPDCGHRLTFDCEYKDERTGEERTIYYCSEGDEEYYFKIVGEYLYCVCLWDGKEWCYGLASQLKD